MLVLNDTAHLSERVFKFSIKISRSFLDINVKLALCAHVFENLNASIKFLPCAVSP
jgi:hypothetical protein